MLSYELCRQLKEAGFRFPSEALPSWPVLYYADEGRMGYYEEGATIDPEHVWIPTLEDLLRELGERFGLLWQHQNRWYAGERSMGGYYSDMNVDDYPHPCEDGATPEEALANLYLALHP